MIMVKTYPTRVAPASRV